MTEGKTEAFLMLFCITKSRHGSFDPSWQTWIALCMCIASASATALSGAYFHGNNGVISSSICFAVSAVAFGMAMVIIIAIMMGCKHQLILTDPVTNDGELTIYTNPVVSEQNTCIQIEHEDLVVSHAENQMWMNPVFKEYDKYLYETDWNLENDSKKTVEKEETDFDERDSESFHSSSETVTCSYRSYSDDEGYFHNSTKETGKYSLGHHGNKLMHEQGILESGQVVENSLVPGTYFDMDLKLKSMSITPQNSKPEEFELPHQLKKNSASFSNIQNCPLILSKSTTDFETKNTIEANLNLIKNTEFYSNNEKHKINMDINQPRNVCGHQCSMAFQESLFSVADEKDIKSAVNMKHSGAYKKQSNDVRLQKSLSHHNSSTATIYIKNEKIPNIDDPKNNLTENGLHYNESISSGGSLIYPTDVDNSIPKRANITSIVHCEFSLPTETVKYQNNLFSKAPITADRRSSSFPTDHNLVSNKQTKQSRNKLNFPAGFPSLPYPILPKESSNRQSKKQRSRSSNSEDAFIPRYEKRPLLDINGKPLSQKDLVKALTGLLTNGLQELPKRPMERKVDQNFQLDIESLQPIPC